MPSPNFQDLTDKIAQMRPIVPLGRVTSTDAGCVHITGLTRVASLGDQIEIMMQDGGTIRGEVVQIEDARITVLPDGSLSGLSVGDRAVRKEPITMRPTPAWLGRVIDPNGCPLDEKPLAKGIETVRLDNTPPPAARRRGLGRRLKTGTFALNTVLPLVQGQRIGLFAGSGVGKSTLLATLVQNVDCDVVVMALIGERGRELRHFTDEVLGADGMQKCVIVASTSDRPALERRRCPWTAMAVAEYFRDQGKSVLFVADSITRFAEAHREIASASGEVPVLRGHPPSTAHLITQLCERAGPGQDGTGDITGVFSVLVQGSDMEEPIADILRGVLDGHVVLNRAIAERGRYPAIDLLQSVSRSLPAAANAEENDMILKTRALLSKYEQNEVMLKSGLYTEGNDPELDLAVKVWPAIDEFLGRCSDVTPEDAFARLSLLLRRAGVP